MPTPTGTSIARRDKAVDDGRERLRRLSGTLVALHAALLAWERLTNEAAHGPVDAAELLRQVIHHEQFAWLRSLSKAIARVDEAVDAPGAARHCSWPALVATPRW